MRVQNGDLLAFRRDNSWIHLSLGLRRLQRTPCSQPGRFRRRLKLRSDRCLAADGTAIGQRRRVVELDIVVIQREQRLPVALLDCAEYAQYDVHVALHRELRSMRGWREKAVRHNRM